MTEIIWTYDVMWRESSIEWASRWDLYLSMAGRYDDEVHWFSIINALLIVLFLSAMVAMIMMRSLHRDITRYNRVPTEEERDEEREETGWKLVHRDVFRPPANFPMLFCVLNGSGVQLLYMSIIVLVFAAVGFLSPALCFFCLRWVSPCADTSCGSFKVAVLLLTAGVGMGGLAFSGYWANFIDLSPRYSGHLMGISNSVATIPGIAGNLITGQILAGRENDWDLVFGLAAGIYVFGAAVFVLFARAERQPFDGADE